jgi:hypothetical protein
MVLDGDPSKAGDIPFEEGSGRSHTHQADVGYVWEMPSSTLTGMRRRRGKCPKIFLRAVSIGTMTVAISVEAFMQGQIPTRNARGFSCFRHVKRITEAVIPWTCSTIRGHFFSGCDVVQAIVYHGAVTNFVNTNGQRLGLQELSFFGARAHLCAARGTVWRGRMVYQAIWSFNV